MMLLNPWEFGGGGREQKFPDMMLSILQVSENVCYMAAIRLFFCSLWNIWFIRSLCIKISFSVLNNLDSGQL